MKTAHEAIATIKAEIERRRNKWLDESRLVKKGKDKSMYAAGKSSAYTEFLSFLDTLEAEEKEVDLEKEIDIAFFKRYPGTEKLTHKELSQIAKHFYNLGLNSKK